MLILIDYSSDNLVNMNNFLFFFFLLLCEKIKVYREMHANISITLRQLTEFKYPKAIEPLPGDSLLFTSKSAKGAHMIDLEKC